MIKKILLACFLIAVVTTTSNAQKSYKIALSLSDTTFNQNNFILNFYDGYSGIQLPTPNAFANSYQEISHLQFPIVELFYFSPKHKPTVLRFFLLNQKVSIALNYNTTTDEFSFTKGQGIISFQKAGEEKFSEFAKKEKANLGMFESSYNYDFTKADSTTLKKYDQYINAVQLRGVEFIKLNPSSLYSLYMFMNEIFGKPQFTSQALKKLYSNYLQPHFKNTFEDKYIAFKLNENKLSIGSSAPFNNTHFKDLKGKYHTLKSLQSPYTLVVFWATWCVPCVAEIPTLKKLYSDYKEKINIVSFSTDKDSAIMKRFVVNNKIDWINIYGRFDFCDVYGARNAIPQVYLINKNGNIVYSRTVFKDSKLDLLEKYLHEHL